MARGCVVLVCPSTFFPGSRSGDLLPVQCGIDDVLAAQSRTGSFVYVCHSLASVHAVEIGGKALSSGLVVATLSVVGGGAPIRRLLRVRRCRVKTALQSPLQGRGLRVTRRAGGGHVNSVGEDTDTDPVQLWSRCLRVGSSYFTDEDVRGDALWRLAGVVGLALAQTAFSVGFSFLQKDFWNALNTKHADEFYHILALQLGAFAIATPIFAFRDFYAAKLANRWRQHITQQILGRYTGQKTYYALGVRGTGIDNPDQRIVDDIRNFTDTAISLFLSVFNALVDLVSFSTVLVSIYTPLLYALALYALGGTFLAYQIGRSLIGYQNLQEQKEADFRYGLVRLRENAEAIAFYDNEEEEQILLRKRFLEAFENFELLVGRRRNLEMFQTGYRLLVQVLPIAVVSPMYFAGAIELGVVTQSYSAFNHVLSDLSLIVSRFESLSQFSTCTNRLAFLVDALEPSQWPSASGESIVRSNLLVPGPQDVKAVRRNRAVVLRASSLTLCTPDAARVLTRGLSFELFEGEAMLITGTSGTGKTSLCRAVAGLPQWNVGSGELMVAARASPVVVGGRLQCLPQQAYMLQRGATLRDQLQYLCGADKRPSEAELAEALSEVGLGKLATELDGEGADWARTLSPGEQQRIAFARLLIGVPAALVVLDEATSALDEEAEQRCYSALRARGLAILSVGHRAALRKVHDRELCLLPEGLWELRDLSSVRGAPLAASLAANGDEQSQGQAFSDLVKAR